MRAKDYINGREKRRTLFNNLIDWEIDRGLQVSKKKVAFDRKKRKKREKREKRGIRRIIFWNEDSFGE